MKKSWWDQPVDYTVDPQPYDGPICRADGRKSFNGYFWPMGGDNFYPREDGVCERVHSWYHFSIVGLADGRWSVSGFLHQIEAGERVFETREAALRSSIAEFIWKVRRGCRSTDRMFQLSADDGRELIAWALSKLDLVATAISIPELPAPPRQSIGLPLFDFGLEA